MITGTFLAKIVGSRDVLIGLHQVPEVDVLEHSDSAGPGELFTVEAYLSPAAADGLRARGCSIETVVAAETLRAEIDRARAQTYPARPVSLVVLRGSGDLLSDLPGRFGVDPPLYSARALEEGGWEVSTEADDDALAAFHAAGLAVEVLETPEILAERRGER